MHAGVRRLPRLIRIAPETGSDAELLRRFAATRDEPAFAELVRRHGPLVLAVCRRVVSDSHLADDAFQATFVVLARKAASAGVGCRLSTWLHSVAVKVSLRARTMAGRRAKRETLTAAVPDVPDKSSGGTGFQAGEAIDEEIDRLPDHLRTAVVLCELRGVGRRDAAKELGIAEGTLSSRLAAARKKLAERLRARGLAPAAATLFFPIFVPTDLAAAAVGASTGKVELSTQLKQLVDGGMKMALLTKLKLAAVAVTFAVLATGGFGGRWGNESAAAPARRTNAPVPKPAVGWKEATPITFDSGRVTGVAYSPSGKTLAVARDNGKIDFYDPATRKHQQSMNFLGDPKANPKREGGMYPAIAFRPTPHATLGDVFAITHKNGVNFGTTNIGLLVDNPLQVEGLPPNFRSEGFDPHQVLWHSDGCIEATNGRDRLIWTLRVGSWHVTAGGTDPGEIHRPTVMASLAGGIRSLWLVLGADRKSIELISFPTDGGSKRPLLSGHESRPVAAAASKDGKRLVSADAGGTLIVWDTKQGLDFKEKSRVSVGPGLAQLALARDGKTVAVLRSHSVDWLGAPANRTSEVFELFVFDVTNPPAKPTPIWSNDARSLPGKRRGPASLAFGPDGNTLLAAFADPYTDDAKLYGPIPKSLGVKVWTLGDPDERKKNAPVPKAAADPGVIWVCKSPDGALTGYAPDGTVVRKLTVKDERLLLAVTPDGQRMLFAGKNGKRVDPQNPPDGLTLHLRPFGDGDAGTDLGIPFDRRADTGRFAFTPDGKKLVHTRLSEAHKVPLSRTYAHHVYDLETKKEAVLDEPAGAEVVDVSPDGTWALALRSGIQGDPARPAALWKVPLDGGKPTELAAREWFKYAAISVDGKSVLASGQSDARLDGARPTRDAVLKIDVASGKLTQVVDHPMQSDTEVGWSPDGKRIAYLWLDVKPLPNNAKAFEADRQRLVVCDPAGKDATTWEVRDYGADPKGYTRLLGWVKGRPAPAAVPPKKNAPVPKEKEETMGLTASVMFDKKEIMLGEPIHFTFAVNNPTDNAWQFTEGGDYRNLLWRPNSFAVTVTGPDGKAVPQPDDFGIQMGGMIHVVKLPADGKASFQPLFLPHWATFEKPGEYTVTVKRKVGLVPADTEDVFRAKATPVNLSATAKITVTPTDAKRMGELVEALGKKMLGPKSDYHGAKKKLLEIRDPRVIPHFIELGKWPYPSYRSDACKGLSRFKTDEAFAALKALYATTGADLKGSATAQELGGVRQSAIGALADCGHPDALPLVWKAVDDGYMGVRLTVLHKAYEVKSPEARKVIAALLTDADERIRGEAKRYTDLLAKEK